MGFVVAIDGPAGSGKGTVTKIIAEKENLIAIDTGAMYRCVALNCLEKNIKETDIEEVEKVLEKIKIEFKNDNGKQKVILNNKDVTEDIRTTKVDSVVAKYAALKCVRAKLTPMQQKMGEKQDIIMEGRDIGTTVFPNANVKIFLECSTEERAKRRFIQNQEKGIKCTYNEILEEIIERNKLETEREISPFVKAKDAIEVDSTNLTIKQVVDEIIKIIKLKKEEKI